MDTSFEAKDRGRPALPPQHKSEARQTIVPKGFCRTYHNFRRCLFEKCSFSHKCYNCGMLHEIVAVEGSPFHGQPGANGKVPQTGGNRATHFAGKNTGQHNTASHPVQKDEATLSVSKTRCCVPTPIKTSKLAQWINGYDRDLAMFLCKGFQRF